MADPEPLEMLQAGPAAWAAWRRQHPGAGPDLRGLRRSGGTLTGHDLSGCRLGGADLGGQPLFGQVQPLRWARFERADLRGARLTALSLQGCGFVGADLRDTVWTGSLIVHGDFRDADLRGADLRGCLIVGARFEGAATDGALTAGTRWVRPQGWPGVAGEAMPRLARPLRAAFAGAGPGAGEAAAEAAGPDPATQQHWLRHDRAAWNAWRDRAPRQAPDLRGADLAGADLRGARLADADLAGADLAGADLREADLSGAFLRFADLAAANLEGAQLAECQLGEARLAGARLRRAQGWRLDAQGADLAGVQAQDLATPEACLVAARLDGADLGGADLQHARLGQAWAVGTRFAGQTRLMNARLAGLFAPGADFEGAGLSQADLSGANLQGARLRRASLFRAELPGADLRGADLREADLVRCDLIRARLEGARLSGARIYGVAAWDLHTDAHTEQEGLRITPADEPAVQVDSLEMAQFVHLLLRHDRLRGVIHSVARRGVLLLGRFGGGGLALLHALAGGLRQAGYLPMIFDFERPAGRNYTETVKTLAGLARFVVVDLSGPSVPQELMATVPHFKIPFIPILEAGRAPHAMFADLAEYPWVHRPLLRFHDAQELLRALPTQIVAPAEALLARRQALLDDLFGTA